MRYGPANTGAIEFPYLESGFPYPGTAVPQPRTFSKRRRGGEAENPLAEPLLAAPGLRLGLARNVLEGNAAYCRRERQMFGIHRILIPVSRIRSGFKQLQASQGHQFLKKLLAIAGMLLLSPALHGGTVIGSRHDLSTPGTPQVCEFCHTPHGANTNAAIVGAPLWNRAETTQVFTLYGSPTMNVAVGQPRVASRLCLSCHDGVNASTVVHGNSVSTKHDLVKPPGFPPPDMTSQPNCERCHTDMYGGKRKLVLGIDLGNDHPISVSYPTPAQDPAFKTPTDAQKGWGGTSPNEVKLYAGWVECGSCHNVHDPVNAPFLRKSNAASALCTTCHSK